MLNLSHPILPQNINVNMIMVVLKYIYHTNRILEFNIKIDLESNLLTHNFKHILFSSYVHLLSRNWLSLNINESQNIHYLKFKKLRIR